MRLKGALVLALAPSLMACASLSLSGSSTAGTTEFSQDLVPLRRIDHRGTEPVASFATYGQCQIDLAITPDDATGLSRLTAEAEAKLHACIATAVTERVNVLILPELSLATDAPTRATLMDEIQTTARLHQMIVIAGSYYDAEHFSRIVIIGPTWREEGYKIHPSRYEVSPIAGLGMRSGRELLLLDTPYGRLAPITCVDLISDAVQFEMRDLADRGQIDVLVNLNYNPASWEFLVEANSIARRHGIIVTITNIAAWAPRRESCARAGDNGSCGGNTALFGSLRLDPNDCPNCVQKIMPMIPAPFQRDMKRTLPYDSLVADIPPFEEGLLVYDLNLRLLREPAATNAPDQGYPTIRNVHIAPIK